MCGISGDFRSTDPSQCVSGKPGVPNSIITFEKWRGQQIRNDNLNLKRIFAFIFYQCHRFLMSFLMFSLMGVCLDYRQGVSASSPCTGLISRF